MISTLLLHGQNESKSKIIHINGEVYNDTLLLNGLLDGNLNYPESDFESFSQYLYNRPFEPMKSIKISNNGTKTIFSPELLLIIVEIGLICHH